MSRGLGDVYKRQAMHSLHVLATQATPRDPGTSHLAPAPLPPHLPWLLLQWKAAPDEDPAQRVCLAIHGHWGTDFQVPKGIKAGDRLKEGFSGHVAEIWALSRGTHPSLVSCSQASLAPM